MEIKFLLGDRYDFYFNGNKEDYNEFLRDLKDKKLSFDYLILLNYLYNNVKSEGYIEDVLKRDYKNNEEYNQYYINDYDELYGYYKFIGDEFEDEDFFIEDENEYDFLDIHKYINYFKDVLINKIND